MTDEHYQLGQNQQLNGYLFFQFYFKLFLQASTCSSTASLQHPLYSIFFILHCMLILTNEKGYLNSITQSDVLYCKCCIAIPGNRSNACVVCHSWSFRLSLIECAPHCYTLKIHWLKVGCHGNKIQGTHTTECSHDVLLLQTSSISTCLCTHGCSFTLQFPATQVCYSFTSIHNIICV